MATSALNSEAASNSQEVGYWLIEPDSLSPLISAPRLRPLAEAVLAWLAAEITARLGLEARSLPLRVIQAEYMGGPYPCLAVAVPKGLAVPPALEAGLEADIEREVTRLLTQTPVADFVRTTTSEAARLAS